MKAALFLALVLLCLASVTPAFAADTTPPTVPLGLTATTGSASPVIATLRWNPASDDVLVSGYRVYRTTTATGTYTQIGGTGGLVYSDQSGVINKKYWYKVLAFDSSGNVGSLSATAGPITAPWTVTPHATYTRTTDLCQGCHANHQSLTRKGILRVATADQGELSVCYSCHDGTASSTNIKSGSGDSFALSSGHTVEALDTTSTSDLVNTCSDCHSPHRDYATRRLLWKSKINGTTITAGDTTWCTACHNDAADWYVKKTGSSYPTASAPAIDASGYPVTGTFPGPTVYASSTANAHGRIPASSTVGANGMVQGDCRWCHATHRGPSKYDGLLSNFVVPTTSTVAADNATGDYAAECFRCHGGTGSWAASGAVDIKQYVTTGGATSGHRIVSATPSAPVNAPLPCFGCHNPHGSTRGNHSLIADTLGKNLETTFTAGSELTRRFCLSCHSTFDGSVWNSVTGTYTAVSATEKVFGLSRNGGALNSGPGGVGYNYLLLKNVSGHLRTDVTRNCYECHGSSYGAAPAINVHSPSAGGNHVVATAIGSECVDCHPDANTGAHDGNVAGIHANLNGGGVGSCNVCHGTYTGKFGTYNVIRTGKTTNCVDCHVSGVIGTRTYANESTTTVLGARVKPHYDQYTTSHTVTAWEPTSVVPYNGGFACTQCHDTKLWEAHTIPTTISLEATTAPRNKVCVGCHID
ncbi:MAG: cytochrome c3 family protein, partial [Coriobacteriia bacterium]|nr:cytochrome c3 family protein [Coriobacteriia bacterium]